MKYLGIDYGTKRIGIAVSDEAASFAFPREIVAKERIVEYLADLIKKEGISGIVVGYSISSNEQKNEIISETETFAKKIETKTSLPVFFEREDFSSVEAHRYQTKAGARDDSAAAIILQRFLDKKRV